MKTIDNGENFLGREDKADKEYLVQKCFPDKMDRWEEVLNEEQGQTGWDGKHEENATAINDLTIDDDNENMMEESSEEDGSDEDITMEGLSKAIFNYGLTCQHQHSRTSQQIQQFICFLQGLGIQLGLRTQIIGSFAHYLWTPASDIDIAFVNVSGYTIDVEAMLQTIYKSLKHHEKVLKLRSIHLSKPSHQTKFPNINLQLNIKSNPRQRVDIIIFQKNNNGLKYVNFVYTWSSSPVFLSLFFIVRGLLERFQMHCQSKGGIRTYTLINMLIITIRHYGFKCLGSALMNFLYYFLNVFQYGGNVNEEGQYEIKLNLIDPLNPSNNIGGKNTNVNKLQEVFKIIYYGLKLGKTSQSDLIQYLFSLNKIFLP